MYTFKDKKVEPVKGRHSGLTLNQSDFWDIFKNNLGRKFKSMDFIKWVTCNDFDFWLRAFEAHPISNKVDH